MNKFNKKYLQAIELLLLFVICYFPLCYRIDALPINQWDEARNAVHTVEMRQNHNFLVRTYNGVPETWEPKPPLLIWLQVISSKIFGLNELAIRFPVILSTFMTVILLIMFFSRFFYRHYIGYLAALILVTSQGYIDRHIARTGDHDALLILFTTGIILHTYLLLTSDNPKKSEFIGLAVLFALGVYVKSVAILFVLPGLFISILIFGGFKKIFGNRWFYISILFFIILTGTYYFAREIIQPGYLKAVWQWEMFPRYANTESRFLAGTFWYYAINFFNDRFTWWIWFLVPAVIITPFTLKNRMRQFFIYVLLNSVVLFTIISAGSKNLWYDGPLFPLFAIIIAMLMEQLLTIMNNLALSKGISAWIRSSVFVIAIIALFCLPYQSIIKKISRNHENHWDKEINSMSYYLRDNEILKTLPDPLKIVFEGYDAHLLFYVKARNYEVNRDRLVLTGVSGISEGDTVLLSQQQVFDSIDKSFIPKSLFEKEVVKLVVAQKK